MTRLPQLTSRLPKLDMRTSRPPPKRADPFYLSSEWRGLLASLIKHRGRQCQTCKAVVGPSGAPIRVIGDHIRERKDGGAELDPNNVMLVCLPCHNTKTAAAAAARMRQRSR